MHGFRSSWCLVLFAVVVSSSSVGCDESSAGLDQSHVNPAGPAAGGDGAASADAATSPMRSASPTASSGAAAGGAPTASGPRASNADRASGGATNSGGCRTFDSSFAAIQAVIFEGHGCTNNACHGEAKSGGLDLRANVAWENLVDVPSTNSKHARVQLGTVSESYLYQKLAAATNPGSVEVSGSPMPVGAPLLGEKELQAMQLWIVRGAPKTGSVADASTGVDIGTLLDACVPAPTANKAKPLEAPAPDEGFQMVMPNYRLEAGTEAEGCIPFAYDFTDKVPAKFKDEARNVIFVNGMRVRQDPQSHHMALWNPQREPSAAGPNDGPWTCHGGNRDGQACDPGGSSIDCGAEGICAGKLVPGTFCDYETGEVGNGGLEELWQAVFAGIGILSSGGLPPQIANTQSPQEYVPPLDGVYSEVPLRGILWFNSHAFNLTEQATVLDARINFYYAQKLEREMRYTNVLDYNYIFDGQPPFTRRTYCGRHVVPQGWEIAMLSGHTHRRGERFWINDAAGREIYENLSYSDPAYTHYDPWLKFEAPDDEARTLEFCATFNNGLTKDGKLDLNLVTRASRMPKRTSCVPVACVSGKVGSSCLTDRDCDSQPGSQDGSCDACPITAGLTTENEMFVMMPWYILPSRQ